MKFNVSGKAFQTQLQAVSKVINSKNALSILDNFLLKVEDDKLYITGSDSENIMTAWVDIMGVEGEGEIAVSSKNLLEITKEVGGQPLEFDINTSSLTVDIKFLNGHFCFPGVDAADYPRRKPQAADAAHLSLPAPVILQGLEYTLFAVSSEPIRPIMTGVYWDLKPDHMVFVSSDTHKLVKFLTHNVQPGIERGFILPAKPAGIIRSLIAKEEGMIDIVADEVSATFTFPTFSMSCRFIKGNYPAYNRVIPTENPFNFTVDRESLLNAMRRVSLFASKASSLVVMSVDTDFVRLCTQDIDYSTSAEEKVPINYTGNPMTIGFNSLYMIEVLNNIKCEEVLVELCDPARPGLFKPAAPVEGQELVMLQMPMQVVE